MQPEIKVTEEMQQQLNSLNDQLNKYRTASVTYTFGSAKEILDSSVIQSWIKINGTEISIDEGAAKSYIEKLAADYNTIYVPRTFRTSYGNDVSIPGNEYGYLNRSGRRTETAYGN